MDGSYERNGEFMGNMTLRRFGAFALAGMLAMSLLAAPAMAEETDTVRTSKMTVNYTLKDGEGNDVDATGKKTLTIENVNAKATYKFFKLLDLTVDPKGTNDLRMIWHDYGTHRKERRICRTIIETTCCARWPTPWSKPPRML